MTQLNEDMLMELATLKVEDEEQYNETIKAMKEVIKDFTQMAKEVNEELMS